MHGTRNQDASTASAGQVRGRWRLVRRGAVLAALLGVTLLPAVSTGSAAADVRSRAIDIMNQSYGGFLNIKRHHEAPFNWSSDGCSFTPLPWAIEQNGPCQLHDFGYANFGRHADAGTALALEPTESRRAWIDQRFLDEMRRNCRQHWWYTSCYGGIVLMYQAVRVGGARWF